MARTLPKLSACVYITCVVLLAYTTYRSFTGTLFGYHPPLMMLAFVLMSCSLFNIRIDYNKSSRADIVETHFLLMMGAFVAAFTGGLFIYLNKEKTRATHMTSWHGVVGYLALSTMVLQFFGGIVVNQSAFKRRFKKSLKSIMQFHRVCGKTVYVLFAAGILLSMYSGWANVYVGLVPSIVLRALVLFLAVCTLFDVEMMYELR